MMQHSDLIYVKRIKGKGRGVFARKAIMLGAVIERVPVLERVGAHAKREMRDHLIEHQHYIRKYGDDLPQICDWKWPC